MKTYLITWNPKRSIEDDQSAIVANLAAGKNQPDQWSCGNNKGIKRGDRVFLLRQGGDQPGIIATATVTKGWFRDKHWIAARAAKGDKANYILIDWVEMVSAADGISRDRLLKENLLPKKLINIASGGVRIHEPCLSRLERAWANHVTRQFKGGRKTDRFGNGINTRAAKLNVLLSRGATIKELNLVRDGASSHIAYLRKQPGLEVSLKGGIYRLVKKSVDEVDKNQEPEVLLMPQPFMGTLKVATNKRKHSPKENAVIRDMQDDAQKRQVAGQVAEKIALEGERTRLRHSGKPKLAPKVVLVSDRPALGYDIRSIETDGQKRFIEVKNVTKGARFFLSENEWINSRSRKNYWFYLVDEKASGRPQIQQIPASELTEAHLKPTQYIVSFDK